MNSSREAYRDALLELMKVAGWTCEVAAEHLGVSKATVLRWRKGRGLPPQGINDRRVLEAFFDAYRVSPVQRGEQEPQKP